MGETRADLIDQLLVMDAQDGSRRAMRLLVERWQGRLWRYARRLAGDEAAADVTQETWLAIIKGLRRLHDPVSFKAWAYRIATNKALDHRNARRPVALQVEQASGDATAHDVDRLTLGECFARLKAASRAVLALYYFEHLSVSEISGVLKVPAGTVKSRLYAAREELKRLWPGEPAKESEQ